jgi:hypothetical protein
MVSQIDRQSFRERSRETRQIGMVHLQPDNSEHALEPAGDGRTEERRNIPTRVGNGEERQAPAFLEI